MGTYKDWIEHFRANSQRHRALEAEVDWDAPTPLDPAARDAFVRSLQRFELGENGDGSRLLGHAAAAGDPSYTEALGLLVQEEQKHSALFLRALRHLDASPLGSHWSDAAFTRLRRLLGLRTELGLFLVAESVALGYFQALAEHAADPVLRAVGRRVAEDEHDHLRFQIDRLREGFRNTPAPLRALVGIAWNLVAVGAATVLVVDHRAALHACGVTPRTYRIEAMRNFRVAARSVLVETHGPWLGPHRKSTSADH